VVVVLAAAGHQNSQIMGFFWMFCQPEVERPTKKIATRVAVFWGGIFMLRRSTLVVANTPQWGCHMAS
jgi:hypothetical protein